MYPKYYHFKCGSSHVSSAQLPPVAHSSKFSQRSLRTCISLWLRRVPVGCNFSTREAVFQLAKNGCCGRKLNDGLDSFVSWQNNQLYHFALDVSFLIFSGCFGSEWTVFYATRTCLNSLRYSQVFTGTSLPFIFHRHPIFSPAYDFQQIIHFFYLE